MIRFNFSKQIQYNHQTYTATGVGVVDATVYGRYKYVPDALYCANGDPGYPGYEDSKVDSIVFNDMPIIEDYDITPEDGEWPDEATFPREEVRGIIAEELTAEDCTFDGDDVEDTLRQENN